MKRIFGLVLMVLFSCDVLSQNTLYNRGGISLSYVTDITKTVFCAKENKNVYFIKVKWTLVNNSGKTSRIYYGITMPPSGLAWCVTEDEVAHNIYQNSGGGSPVILKSGESTFGENAGWYFDTDIVPGWGIPQIDFARPATLKSKTNWTNAIVTKPKAQSNPIYSVYQNDNLNNPASQVEEPKKQSDEDKAAAEKLKVWQEIYKQAQAKKQDDAIIKIQQDQIKKQQDLHMQTAEVDEKLKLSAENQVAANLKSLKAINGAIEITGNTILDLIQSGKAKKAATGKALVNSFAQNLYDNKTNVEYYRDNTNCEECDGTGIMPGYTITCVYCNGLGKYYKPIETFYKAQKTDPNNLAMTSLVSYLNKHQSKSPIYEFLITGYNGIIRLVIVNACYTINAHLVVESNYHFRFLKKNGEIDPNGYIDNSLIDYKVIPLSAIIGVRFIPGETKFSDAMSVQVFDHFGLILTNGESFEFNSSDPKDELNSNINNLINLGKAK